MSAQRNSSEAASMAALHSEEVLRRLIESVQDYAIFTLSPSGFVASWNVGAQRIKGYDANEIIGLHFSKFYPEEALAAGWPGIELHRAAEQGRFEDEGWRVRKDGSRFWANVIITALRSSNGELLGFSKITRDLTERRLNEQRLKDSEERLRLLVEGVKDHAIFMLDPDGIVIGWNAGAQRVHGFGADDIVGRSVADLSVEEDVAAGTPQAELALAGAVGYSQSSGWRTRQDGSWFWADVTVTALPAHDGAPRGFVQVTRDLTEWRRVQELETEGRRVNEFIAMLAHELRNPLAPIGNAVGILEKLGNTPQLQWCANLIGRQVTHLSRLVDDLLDVSRITSGKIQLRRERLELGGVVANAVDSMRPIVERFHHTLDVVLPLQPLHVNGDATRLTQVLVNLVTNSAKYTPNGGRVQVRLERRGTNAMLSVADNGIGMSRELLATAFNLFTQGERALDRAEGGLGIGLTLVERIVHLHGGVVVAASDGSGRGTEMTVSLPMVDQPLTLAVDRTPS
ncbi:sensor histidine kinase [Piscinibacter sp.]|uniref:sensor histidine kinase n=1 Tax=Piscinibacter sp. TaxID=1903157 RepID=UPI002C4596F3|nr:PAS domain-containing sensor histidine kinase [Albitalea sp.]HUG25700.1 PAS domain-containing sensor histidine kinase [Albitalea sp.]